MIPTKLFKKHLQNVKFYPRADDFTHALHVMHVTNIMSGKAVQRISENSSDS